MNVSDETLKHVRQWIEKAEHDLTNAERTLTLKENCPFDTVCFHAQKCAEKYLKGFRVFQSIDFSRTHDLVILLKLIAAVKSVGISVGEVQPLNRYTVEARYPGDWEPISREEAEEALGLARKVREAVRAYLPREALDKD